MAAARASRCVGAAAAAALLLAACSSGSPTPTSSIGATPSGKLPPGGTAPATAAGLQQTLVDVIRRVRPSVVQVQTSTGLGSGVVFDRSGDIVTNAHVVGTAATLQVSTAEGRTYPATTVGIFAPDDLAVVRVQDAAATRLPAATFADSSTLAVGDIVLAIGNPLGLSSSVTEGIISATGRTVSEGNGVVIPDAVQTSAAINPGNSGGALVDLSGDVVGIPTLAATDPQLGGGAAPGIGFAIPSSTARDIAGQIAASGRVTSSHRALLGVTRLATVTDFSGTPLGVLIAGVVAGGPADSAGLRPGDIITAVDGRPVTAAEALQEAIAQHRPGDRVVFTVRRDDGDHSITVTLGEQTG
ncbi:MAG TPA: trypsin-like peptidase domain-containing protein [Candidatus Dormibacteraeota bacterium]|nr:trypsin-like peptidase domain-containing protein [Candidatus Dormibacteraeota bacterium]